MKFNPATLPQYLQYTTHKEHGDRFEREYGHFLMDNFPNCEVFWKKFVVPFTKRIEGYPNQIIQSTEVRQGIDSRIEDIANSHYSMFLNLVFAHLHLETKTLSSLESIYTHLGSACDLVEMTLEKWYFLLLICQGKESKVLQGLSRDEFLEEVGKWYDEKYSSLYQYYLSRGKNPPIDLISSSDILVEYLGKQSVYRKNYMTHSQIIRQFRNVIVHDVKVARIINETLGESLIPKPKVIGKYRSWRNVLAVANNKERIYADFAEPYQQAKDDLITLERILDDIWEILVKDFEGEFYSANSDALRKMYDIEFSSEGPIVLNIKSNNPDDSPNHARPSGMYTGGTLEYRRSDDDFKPY
jgi:hypothetical protein